MKRLTLFAAVFACLSSAAIAQDDEKVDPGFNEQTFKGLEMRSIGPAFMSGRIADIAIDAHVPGTLVAGIDGDVGDAPRHERRPDTAHFETFEGLLVESRIDFLVIRSNGGRRQAGKYGGE